MVSHNKEVHMLMMLDVGSHGGASERVLSSSIQRHAVRYKSTDVSDEFTVSVFRDISAKWSKTRNDRGLRTSNMAS
jgi:hypothetical protein